MADEWDGTYTDEQLAFDAQVIANDAALFAAIARHGHHDCPDGPDAHEDYCLNGRQE